MNKGKAFSYFQENFDLVESSNGWYYFVNPFDAEAIAKNKKKCCVNFKYNSIKDWTNNYKSSIGEFIKLHENISYNDMKDLVDSYDETDIDLRYTKLNSLEMSEVEMPTGFKTIIEGNSIMSRRARSFLTQRGFNIETLDEQGFGYCNEHDEDFKEDYFGRIIIPFKKHGKLKYYIGRDFLDGDPKYKYKNPKTEKFGIGKSQLVFNEDALQLEDTVFITEGWSDAKTIGSSGIALLGWSISSYQFQIILMSNCKTLVFIHDKGFRTETLKAAIKFVDHKNVCVPNLEPLFKGDCKDINDVGTEKVLEFLGNDRQFLTRSDILKQISL